MMNIGSKLLKIFRPGARLSYSQFGEDIIIEYLFSQLRIDKPTYLDIGANDPRIGSNTYMFYRKGSKGVLIEPNPDLAKLSRKVRRRDTTLNIGVGFEEGVTQSDYFKFPSWASGLNTFSKEQANYWQTIGHQDFGKIQIEAIIPIYLDSVNNILNSYFNSCSPNLISIDIEGIDFQILQSIDFEKCKSEVICVETMGYDNKQKTFKRNDIVEYLLSKSYMIFADTRVNTIFCKNDLFNP